ncbi:ShlB/FhaC/HecB family hemolysin secretion/activation protein [Methylovulum miyakonense]|uniref:ShlB/FhaC/HecB family hemolysin secretion/activation protein n=1 Tax=Methylovulum miyakonense TaxID=645578 RepID=UPI000687B92F|nr:ShlB/FhaC/HecB family hemolysin secretion/activation protein [Methylovulum miyakonense]
MPLFDIKRGLLVKSVVFSILLGSYLPVISAAEQAESQDPRFDLFELRVKGNTLLERKQLERTVYPFLGPKKTIETVEKARGALEKLYHDQGYQTVGVDIPEQDVQNGVVYLQVVEGKVSRLRVKDSRYFSLGSIKAGVPELAEGHVPNMPKMQEQLAAIDSQSNDRKVTPILRPGEAPGTVDVDLKVKDDLPLHGSVALNGRNTSSTSLLRLVSTLHYDNLWQKFHSASFTYQVSPEESDEVDVIVGTYSLPLFDNSAKLALYGVSSSSNAQIASGGALSVIGNGQIFGARFIKPLPTIKNYSHSIVAGIDYKDFKEDLKLISSDSIKTPISYLPFTLQYNSSVRGEKSFTSMNVGVNFSMRGLGNTQAEFEEKRLFAQSNYAVLLGGVNFTHELPYGMEFFSRFSGQLADSPLISNEQFSLGGMQSIRGYFETQALTDDGIIGSFEWRSPRLVSTKLDYINKLQALVFLDAGKGWTQRALPGNAATNELASAGVGTRFQMWKYFVGALDIGFPLIDLKPVYQGDPKVHFNIATEF